MWVALALAAGVLSGLGLATAPLAHAAETPTPTPIGEGVDNDTLGDPNTRTWSIQPATKDGPDKRPFISETVSPGDKLSDFVAVTNYSLKPLTVSLYPADAINTESGEFTLKPYKDKPVDAGKWIAIPNSNVTIPARNQILLPFDMFIPTDAEPGDHTAGIVASVVTQQADDKGGSVAVEQRVGTRVYLRVLGELSTAIELTDMSVTYSGGLSPLGGAATVRYTIENTGNIRVNLAHTTTLSGLFGLGRKTVVEAPKDELLPGESALVEQRFNDVLPTIRLSADASVAAVQAGSSTTEGGVTATGSASTWAMPWVLLLAIVGLVLLFVGGRRLQQRRARRAAATQAAAIDAAVAQATAALTGNGSSTADDSTNGDDPTDSREQG